MVSGDTIAVVDKESATLQLWRIVEETDGGAPSLCTIVRLGLPPLVPEAYVLYSSCIIRESVPAYSDAPSLVTEGRPSRRFPFHSSTEDGLIVIVMNIGDHALAGFPNTNVTIVTRLHTLVTLATRTSPGVTFIPWENWGPRVTACFNSPVDSDSDVLIGDRLTTISDERLSLFDFNSSRIRNTIRRTGNTSGGSAHVTTVIHGSVIPRGRWFREDVVGKLPYISCVRPSPSYRKSKWCLTNYEEELALLSWDFVGDFSLPPLLLPGTDYCE